MVENMSLKPDEVVSAIWLEVQELSEETLWSCLWMGLKWYSMSTNLSKDDFILMVSLKSPSEVPTCSDTVIFYTFSATFTFHVRYLRQWVWVSPIGFRALRSYIKWVRIVWKASDDCWFYRNFEAYRIICGWILQSYELKPDEVVLAVWQEVQELADETFWSCSLVGLKWYWIFIKHSKHFISMVRLKSPSEVPTYGNFLHIFGNFHISRSVP